MIKVKKLHPQAKLPKKSTDGSACFDIYTLEDIYLTNNTLIKARTGLAFEIPKGYFVETRMRSGLATKGVIIPNAPTTIDSDYRGEVLVPLFNLFGEKLMFFGAGSRIAQCRVVKETEATFKICDNLSDTERGSGGFGSTGTA